MNTIEIHSSKLQNFKQPQSFELDQENQNLWINNVFGVNKDGVLPARFLSGFIATFDLARLIIEESEGEIVPTIRIFRPTQISKFINGISEDQAAFQNEQGNKVLTAFATRHFPDIEMFIDEDEEVTADALSVLDSLTQLIDKHCDPQTIQQVRDSGRRRGGKKGEEKALLYVAHHPFGWSDLHHPSIFKKEHGGTIINTLPPSEKKYSEVRRVLRELRSPDIETITLPAQRQDLVINMCGTAHYIFIENENGQKLEPTLTDLLSVSCAEILLDMEQRFKSETNPFLRDNLRRAHRDMEKLLLLLASKQAGEQNIKNIEKAKESGRKKTRITTSQDIIKDASFKELLGGII